MLAAVVLSVLVMTAIVALRYLAASGIFALATLRVRPGLYNGLRPQIRREIGWSLASAAIYGIPAGIVAWGWAERGWTLIYTDWYVYPLWYLGLAPLLYLFLHDTWFYWTHRWMHRPRPFRTMHAVHHASRPPTAWAAMSFHPYEAVTGAIVIPALVFLVPIHVAMLGLVLLVMTVMGVTNHMGWEMFPRALVHSRLGGWLITASHHQRHHEQYRCNYGLYFRFWDRLCAHRPRSVAALSLAAGVALLIGAAPAPVEVEVLVSDLRSAKGVVRACMTADPVRFPKCRGDAASYRQVVPATDGERLVFRGVTPGHYAIALLHDENGNGKADRALGMMPREGFGFSRDAPVRMGPPDFGHAAFNVEGKPVQKTIRMRYML